MDPPWFARTISGDSSKDHDCTHIYGLSCGGHGCLPALMDSAPNGCVANFTQEGMKEQLPLSAGELSGQGIELFGRSEVLVSGLDHQLSFPHSSWVATRRGLHKPISSSPPFKTGLAAFTAPGLTPSVLLRSQTAPRSVPSHFSSSTGVHPWTACAFAGYLCSSLSEGEGPSPSVLILVCPAFLGSDYSAPSDSCEDIGSFVGLSLTYSPLPFTFLTSLPCSS
jgi:hypothetical protein